MERHRGRKSAAERLLAPPLTCIDVSRKPVDTPAGLQPEVRKIFQQVVANSDAQHFRAGDIPLLVSYCTATHLASVYAGRIGESDAALKWWVETTKLQISLATKLRLTPSSRTDPKTIGRQQEPFSGRPWDPRGDRDD
jgi:hypothetical protein